MLVERGIPPGPIQFVGQALQSREKPLTQFMRPFLVRRLAKIDATTKWTGFASRTSTGVILPGAARAVVERARRRGRVGRQDLGLHRGQEQGVVILRKSATPTAQLADRTRFGHLAREIVVDHSQLASQAITIPLLNVQWLGLHDWVPMVHIGVRITDATMASREYKGPWPEPGQTRHVRSQSWGVSTFSLQNGQVRHCSGRAE